MNRLRVIADVILLAVLLVAMLAVPPRTEPPCARPSQVARSAVDTEGRP